MEGGLIILSLLTAVRHHLKLSSGASPEPSWRESVAIARQHRVSRCDDGRRKPNGEPLPEVFPHSFSLPSSLVDSKPQSRDNKVHRNVSEGEPKQIPLQTDKSNTFVQWHFVSEASSESAACLHSLRNCSRTTPKPRRRFARTLRSALTNLIVISASSSQISDFATGSLRVL